MTSKRSSAALSVRAPSSSLTLSSGFGAVPTSGSSSMTKTRYSESLSGPPSSGRRKTNKRGGPLSKRAANDNAGPGASLVTVGKELLPVAGATLAFAAADSSSMGQQFADVVGAEPSTVIGGVCAGALLLPKTMVPKALRKAALKGLEGATMRLANRGGEFLGSKIPDFYGKKASGVSGVEPSSAPVVETTATATDA